MLKGIQKNVIYIQLPKGKNFEAAYFVLRPRTARDQKPGEMVREANRIILQMEPRMAEAPVSGGKTRMGRGAFFLYGALAGSFGVAVAWLITLILC